VDEHCPVLDLLDRIGWSEADTVLAPLVPAITRSTRYDRLPYMRRFLRAWQEADLADRYSAGRYPRARTRRLPPRWTRDCGGCCWTGCRRMPWRVS